VRNDGKTVENGAKNGRGGVVLDARTRKFESEREAKVEKGRRRVGGGGLQSFASTSERMK